MDITQSAVLRQEQRLGVKLNQQQIQSIRLMELPIADLRLSIDGELQKNPALEIVKDNSFVSLDRLNKSESERFSRFDNSSDLGIVFHSGGKSANDIHREFIEGALTRPETLQEHLLWQLRLEPLSPAVRAAGELIVQNLSEDGFNRPDMQELLNGFSRSDIDAAFNAVRSLDPQGCACDDYKESLVVQARLRYGKEIEEEIKLLIPHLTALERDQIKAMSKTTGLSEDKLKVSYQKLKNLSPFPGRQFGEASRDTRFIVPDVRVVRKDNEFSIIINNEEIPVLGIAPFFLRNAKTRNPAERDFIRENLKEAQWFIGALNRRNRTVFRVARAIVHYQKKFFLHGPKYLAPLGLAKIAEKLKLHETTVSRAANGKYIETEWGIFEIRYFFSSQVRSTSGEKHFSKGGVKEIMREIIEQNSKNLSDNDIAELLSGRGIKIARRTVNKYRNELELGSSYTR